MYNQNNGFNRNSPRTNGHQSPHQQSYQHSQGNHAAQPPAPPQQPTQQSEAPEKPWTDTMRLKVFGGKAALEFYETATRAKVGGKGWQTIQIDAAFKLQGREEFDWNNKSIIQITRTELPVFIAVMLGIREKCSYHSHGPNKDKGFDITRQQDKGSVFFRVHEGKGSTKAVPIDMVEAIMIGHMALAQYLSNYDGRISADVVMNSLHALPAT